MVTFWGIFSMGVISEKEYFQGISLGHAVWLCQKATFIICGELFFIFFSKQLFRRHSIDVLESFPDDVPTNFKLGRRTEPSFAKVTILILLLRAAFSD